MKKFLLSLLGVVMSIGIVSAETKTTTITTTSTYVTASGSTATANSADNNATVTFAYSADAQNDASCYRIYSGDSFTVKCNEEGATIKSVKVIGNSDKTAASKISVTTTGITTSIENNTKEYSSTVSITSGKISSITLKASAQVRTTSIIVTYDAPESGPKTLGDIIVSCNGNTFEDNGSYTITEGDAISISADNAAGIFVELEEGNDLDPIEGTSYIWAPEVTEYDIVTVTAYTNDNQEKSISFAITVNKKSTIEPDPNPQPTPAETYTDEIVVDNFSKLKVANAQSYTTDSYTSTISGVTYKVNIAHDGKGAFQLNKTTSNGIIVSENPKGYTIKSIMVNAFTTTANRTINIRGNATVLSEINNTSGTEIGSLSLAEADKTYDETFTPEYDYQAFSLTGAKGAFYINKVTIVWKKSTGDTKGEAGLDFTETIVNYDINDEFEAQTLVNPNTLEVTWSSSDKKVATIDAATGEIKIEGIGTTVIKAAFAGNETTNPGWAQYTLNVSDRTITNVTFDFVNKEYGMTRHTSGSDMNPDPVVFSSEDGWVGAVATGKTRLWSTNGFRVWGTSKICFYAPETCELVAAKVLNADGSENSARTKEFKIEGQVATYTCGLQATSNTDLPKIQISYKGVAEEDIQAAFAASEKFTVTINGEVASDGTHAKTSQADAVVSLKHHYPHAKVYHKWTPVQNGGTNQVIRREPMEGFTEHTEALSLATAGTLQYYAELNGLQTPVQTLTVTGATTTSIAEISADKAAAIYDLQGRKVSKGGHGLFIQGGKVVRF